MAQSKQGLYKYRKDSLTAEDVLEYLCSKAFLFLRIVAKITFVHNYKIDAVSDNFSEIIKVIYFRFILIINFHILAFLFLIDDMATSVIYVQEMNKMSLSKL